MNKKQTKGKKQADVGSSEDEVLFKRVNAPNDKQKDPKDDELRLDLGSSKLVRISEFKGKKYVDIRQHFEKDGDVLPTKKGISLNLQQFELLMHSAQDIIAKLKDK